MIESLALAAVSGALISGVGAWLVFGRDTATRGELNEAMTQNNAEHCKTLELIEKMSGKEDERASRFYERMQQLQLKDQEQTLLINQLRCEFERCRGEHEREHAT